MSVSFSFSLSFSLLLKVEIKSLMCSSMLLSLFDLSVGVCMFECVHMHLCVCEREREGERLKSKGENGQAFLGDLLPSITQYNVR